MNDETKTPEVEVIAEPVVPEPVVVPPVVAEPVVAAPPVIEDCAVRDADKVPETVNVTPLVAKVVPGTITVGTIVPAAALDASIDTIVRNAIKIQMPAKRTVIDVMREPQTIEFQGLTIDAKFIDGLPALVFSADDGDRPLIVLAGRNGRFVVEY